MSSKQNREVPHSAEGRATHMLPLLQKNLPITTIITGEFHVSIQYLTCFKHSYLNNIFEPVFGVC